MWDSWFLILNLTQGSLERVREYLNQVGLWGLTLTMLVERQ